MPERVKTALPLAAVLALAFALRLYGLAFGLPMVSNLYVRPDETLLVVPGVRFFETAGNPASLDYPLLLIVLNAVLFQGYFWVARGLALTQAPDLVADFVQHSATYWLLARGISVVAGTLTVWLVYLIARRVSSRGAALMAALLYATAPLAVRDAHFATTDNLLTLLLAAALYAALRWLDAPQGTLLPAAIWLGLAVSTKYAGWLLLPALMAAALVKTPRRISWRWLGWLVVPPAVFALVNPYALVRYNEFAGLLRSILTIFYLHQPWDAPWTVAGALNQVWMPLRHGPGQVAGLVFCAAGLLWPSAEPRSRPQRIVLALGMLSCLLAIFLFRHWVPYRYVLPALPVVAVFAAKGVFDLSALVRRPVVGALLGALLLLPGAWNAARIDYLLTQEDTRTLARRWIEQNVPRDVPVVILGGPEAEPQVLDTPASLERRMGYVARLYGKRAGNVISEPYRLQLLDPTRSQQGY